MALVDDMIAATVSAQTFVKEATIYYKIFSNMDAVHTSAQGFLPWLQDHGEKERSISIELLLFKSEVYCLFKDNATSAIDLLCGPRVDNLLNRMVEHQGFARSNAYIEIFDDWLVVGLLGLVG